MRMDGYILPSISIYLCVNPCVYVHYRAVVLVIRVPQLWYASNSEH